MRAARQSASEIDMRPERLNPLFADVASLPQVRECHNVMRDRKHLLKKAS